MDGVELRIEVIVRLGVCGVEYKKSRVFRSYGQGEEFRKCNDPIFVDMDIQKITPIHLKNIASAIQLWVSLWYISQVSSPEISNVSSVSLGVEVFRNAPIKPSHHQTKQNKSN
jgi:hypothetical protein